MGRQIEVYVTDYAAGKFLEKQPDLQFKEDTPGYRAQEANIFNIYDQIQYQEIVGFGGALTQASAVNLFGMSKEKQKEIMQAYFDPEEGIGYSFCRATINSCDFSTESYAYDETPGDFELKDFTIEHDRKDVIPMIKEAYRWNPGLQIFSSPWSPPHWMKTNGRMDKGRYLKKDCRQVWADYFVRYLEEYEKEGIPVWGVTIQNEPNAEMGWESCFYNDQEERDFLENYLKPAFERAGRKEKILFWDHNKERAVDRALEVASSEKAKAAADGIALHWYVGDHFGALDAIHEMMPGKFMIGTEACVGTEKKEAYAAGEKYAHDIIGDLNHWANGWVDWNMILDDTGRPDHWMDEQVRFKERYEKEKPEQEDLLPEEQEFLTPCLRTGIWVGEAPIVVKSEDEFEYKSTYYYMGHFSKFIRPGAVRIGNSVYTKDLDVCAFRNPNGQMAAVVLNHSDSPKELVLRYHKEIAGTTIQAHSIATFLFS